ncbi:hypothetical protein KKH27_13795 [bacterium]|nr:hypothetical protein [bacterium]MBU1983739.1 hypothetical protein [bacterium]
MVNNTLCYLLARGPISTMGFSAQTGTGSIYLNGPGGQSGDGFPMPRAGYVTGLHVWDGTKYSWDAGAVAFEAGDRLSVYCQSTGSNFIARVRKNGGSIGLETPEIPYNSSVLATVEFILLRD